MSGMVLIGVNTRNTLVYYCGGCNEYMAFELADDGLHSAGGPEQLEHIGRQISGHKCPPAPLEAG